MKTHLYRASNFEVNHHFFGLSFMTEINFWRTQKPVVSCDKFIITECGSTLYVLLARGVSPTNKNFRLTVLLTRLQVALYKDLPV